MSKLKDWLYLSDKGYKDLKKAIFAVTITNFSLMLPVIVSVQIFIEILKPFTQGVDVDWDKMWILFVLGVISAIIVYICHQNDYEKTYITSYRESGRTRIDIAEHVRKLPMSFFNEKNLSEVTTNIMGDCAAIEHVLSHLVPQLIANAISITIICILLSLFDWRMSLSVFCTLPISFFIIIGSRKLQKKFSEKHITSKLEVADKVQEYLEGIKIIKAFGMDGNKSSDINNSFINMKKTAMKVEFFTGIFVTISNVILQSGIGITLFVGTYLLSGGKLDVTTFLLFSILIFKIYGPIIVEFALLAELFFMQIVTKRMRKLKETPIIGGTDIYIREFDIKLTNVSFEYNNNNLVIDNINCVIPENKITAIVGPSGGGKSTLCKLIARFWDVKQGNITIGNVDIKKVNPEHLMQYMSFVFQDVILFNDTVFNNIKIGNENATREQVLEAAKLAMCDEFIQNMPNGYDSMLGENGCTISGGERQRISIARALLKDSPIVLLDEATASLDPENEVYIQRAISKLVKNKTVIIVAHRLRTIVGADKIIVLENGKIREEGNHNELLQKEGLYAKLYNIQKDSLGWMVK